MSSRARRRCGAALAALALLGMAWWSIPVARFDEPTSTVLLDREGRLLSAHLAADEQWRFPPAHAVPPKLALAMVVKEDKRFWSHPGVDVIAVARAAWQNLRAGQVQSGASTLTMQCVKLSRGQPRRSVGQKLIEALMALKLETRLDKEHILALYAAHAPFGGNAVGLEAAAWRYFGRAPERLSWAEACTLAVLPSTPALIHPGRNREALRHRRDRLLRRLSDLGHLDRETLALALTEPLPQAPQPVPRAAPHLGVQLQQRHQGQRVRTTLDLDLQRGATRVVERHVALQASNGVHNAAALVLAVDGGEVLAYVGNAGAPGSVEHGAQVDVVTAPRSTGSVLKPLLYAAMLEAGALLPEQLIADIPTSVAGFSPENYSKSYAGAVPAAQALARSLNVPAVRLLHDFGVDRTHALLRKLGMRTLDRPAADYGLSLILGGAEGSLWDLCGIYAGLARAAKGVAQPFFSPRALAGERPPPVTAPGIGAGAAYLTLQAMVEVNRPGERSSWRSFDSSAKVAWKTGTSFGFRDAWAIGVTPTHAVGVWVGNADGEGRPGLVGLSAAAPVLFDLLDLLPRGGWFEPPREDLVEVQVCAHSGFRAGPRCADTRPALIPRAGLDSLPCPYCHTVHCDAGCQHRVNASCEATARMQHQPWFVLPPSMEHYYARRHAGYRRLPPWRDGCAHDDEDGGQAEISCIYPRPDTTLYVPIELDGRRGRAVFEAAHRRPDARLFWHLDDSYLGETRDLHQLALAPAPGDHVLTLVDDRGARVARRFHVMEAGR